MGARHYDPALGRWLSADTIVPDLANPQSFNRYAYVQNSPLNYVDPTGHMEDGECGPDGEQCQFDPPPIEEIIAGILQGMVDSIFDPGRTEPIQLALPDGTLLVIMPASSDSTNPRFEKLGDFSQQASGFLSALGLGLDALELAFIWTPATESASGLDIIVTLGSSWLSGETVFPSDQLHPSLPPIFALGQDVLWTAGIDWGLPKGAGLTVTGLLGPEAGVVAHGVTDSVTTAASLLWYDRKRVEGSLGSYFKAGFTLGSEIKPIILFYPDP